METSTEDAAFYRYQRLFGVTEDGLQMKLTVITGPDAKVKSASIQMRAVEGPVALTDHPSRWSRAFPLTMLPFGDGEFESAS
jgi:hypothetical protein